MPVADSPDSVWRICASCHDQAVLSSSTIPERIFP
jgi:hypothetical protein